jgi:hypothetical protein
MALALFAATCAPKTHHDAPVALLQARFPAHAERVLGVAGGTVLAAAADGSGFVPAPLAGADPVKAAEAALTARGGLRSSFPPRGDGAVRLSLPDGFAIEAREHGPRRAGRVHGNALVYEHGNGAGTSFWSATTSGFEEWLLVPAAGDAPVATWDVTGATLRQRGAAVEVVDGRGTARLTVTAPAAYAQSGAPLRTRLRADGVRLALTVEGPAGAGLVLVDPAWQAAGPLAPARGWHTATLLPSGKVLVAGGSDSTSTLASAELYDPVAGTFAPTTGPLATARMLHTATLLPSGKVLVAGGYNSSSTSTLASAELYDPVAGTFAPTAGPLATAREWHTATLLPSGKVLVAGGGGSNDGSTCVASAELYDPVAGTFAPTTGPMATARAYYTATLLPSGKVLVAGGSNDGSTCVASAELYDPVAGTFAPTTAPLATARCYPTATLLPSGRVLVAGGWNNSTGELASAELYDPAAGTFAPTTGPLATARHLHTATLLPSGKVLVAGGATPGGPLASAELYDPVAGTFAPTTGPLATARFFHTATLLPSGNVLAVGGGYYDGNWHSLASAELYDPPAGAFGSTTGSMATAREAHTATLLPSGKALVAGGFQNSSVLASAELYDPVAGTFAPTGPLATARWVHAATMLSSSKVLVTGGCRDYPSCTTAFASAELYDPVAGTFAPTTVPMATARGYHTATLLLSGKVLVAGGYAGGGYLASAELYDPVAGTFAPTTGPLATARAQHTATLLPSGKVLLAGGYNSSTGFPAAAELYDPVTGTFAPTTGSLTTPRYFHTATLLPSGKVLVAAGQNGSGYLAAAELFDPIAGTFTPTGSLATARYLHAATLLPSGKVLVAGGHNGASLASAELFDPVAGTFAPTSGPLTTARWSPTATLLPSGKVLVAGGDWNDNSLASAELYDEGRGAQPGWTPTLDGPLATVIPGGTLPLTGTLFKGVSAASSGSTQTSDTNFPLLLVIRVDNQQLAYSPTTGFTATSATAAIPADLPHGPYVAWVVVNGVLSNGVGLLIELPQGAPCTADPDCASLHCVDGVCCDTACAGGADDCQACSAAAGAAVDGTCGSSTGNTCDDGNPCTNTDICTAGACGGAAYTCADGLACTTDVCNGDGTCTFTLTDGNCSIGGACYTAGATNPGNQCQQCTPGTSPTAWSDKANGTACGDGRSCTRNDVCTGGVCGGTTYACDDGLACTIDSCNGNGCTFTIAAGSCSISGVCYTAGATNPGNQCQQCTPSTSQTTWSPKTTGCGADAGATGSDGPDAPSMDGTLQILDTEMDLARETGRDGGQQAGLDGPKVPPLDSGTSDATSDVATIGTIDARLTGGDTPAVVPSPDGPVSPGVPDGALVSVDTPNATADAMPIRQDGSQVVAADAGGIDGPASPKGGSSGGCGCAVGGANSGLLGLPMCILALLGLLRAKHSRRRR